MFLNYPACSAAANRPTRINRFIQPRALGRKASDEFSVRSVESIIDWCTA
jgi:hypothetical protein